jgi:hypothetical protein
MMSAAPHSRLLRAGSKPVIPAVLAEQLNGCALHRASGVLRVTGEPGGSVHLADGGVVAISTAGAPGPEVILLRSGRVPETGWSSVFSAAASKGVMKEELVKRDFIGAGELESLLRLAVADAMFALAAGQVEDCELEQEPAPCLLPLEPPAPASWLLGEAGRRIGVLAAAVHPVVHDRDRVSSVQGAWTPVVGPGDGQAEILALANGRRTARDIAFMQGRGVYAVTLQLTRMCGAGVLTVGSSRGALPERPAPAAVPALTAEPAGGGAPALPRRRRGSSGAAGPRQQERSSVLRMLRPGSGTHRQPEK